MSATPKKVLRSYQRRISKTCIAYNTVVLLPTGSGKTLIAAECILQIGKPALFFVPTIPLVTQQANALQEHLGVQNIGEYHGGKAIPTGCKIIVTTPKAFEVAQQRGEKAFAWSQFGVVVFDEVHHVLKDHPFRVLASKLRSQTLCCPLRIVGLTASLTYAVGNKKIEISVRKLCAELQIEKIEHATDKELREGGYKGAGRGAVAEVRLPEAKARSDVFRLEDRKPHLMHTTFFRRIKQGTATKFSIALFSHIRSIEERVIEKDPTFMSPLSNTSLKKWGEYAHSRTNTSALYMTLEHWYEGLRLLVVSWEEADDAVVVFLRMMLSDEKVSDTFLDKQPLTFPRFENLCTVLSEKINEDLLSFRGIVFVQQRVLTHVVQYYLAHDKTLKSIIKSRCLYATSSPATSSLGVSRTESNNALRAFRTAGEANLLISTSVAEEGLDIPEANCVLYFDPIHHAVSYVQGRGRARQENSSFVVLAQRTDRPATLLAEQEKEQHRIASSCVLDSGKRDVSAADIKAQQSRERGALAVLVEDKDNNPIASLNLYCKKTKVTCEEISTSVSSGGHQCTLNYISVLRSVTGQANGSNRKMAKKLAAVELLTKLTAMAAIK